MSLHLLEVQACASVRYDCLQNTIRLESLHSCCLAATYGNYHLIVDTEKAMTAQVTFMFNGGSSSAITIHPIHAILAEPSCFKAYHYL